MCQDRRAWAHFTAHFGHTNTNPGEVTLRVRPPESPVGPSREARTLTEVDLGRYLEAVQQYSPDRYVEILLMGLTGMRPGEVYGLKWDCVDFEGERIIVKRGVSNGILTETTKTKAQRIVPIHPDLALALQEHRQRMIRDQHPGLATNLVFPSSRGKLRFPQSLAKVHALACDAAKIDIHVTPQVLRRTFNTLLVRAGVDRITLRAMMGHTTEQMTERYAGVALADKKAAVVNLFAGTSKPVP